MSNIWEFLLQTGTVSLTALLLLLCKRIFADKLSPRWQYGIWFLLALRILLPVQVNRVVLFPLPLFLEVAKSTAEGIIGSSAYAQPYVPLSLSHVLPIPDTMPVSVTDWLFVTYGVGVIGSFLLVLIRYWRFLGALRRAVDRRCTVPSETMDALALLRDQYRLPACPLWMVPGLPSPFVCGFFRPVLVLPAGEADETVLLHELLHLRYRDVWQHLFWCALRSLHWCNPFLWFVCRRIENDMESLCDTRVLERLTGEDRRHYGTVLLSMVREKYARAPGTTSVSNGGKNIARRIDAIVRFRKYPAGMGTVSVCMALVMAVPLLWGTGMTYDKTILNPRTPLEMQRSLATTRLKRCGTIAGALDTYAKGQIAGNGILQMAAAPLSSQAEIAARTDLYGNIPLDDDFQRCTVGGGYRIYNLAASVAGGYEALMVFPISGWGMAMGEDNLGMPHSATLFIPVRVWQQDGGWVVEEARERIRSFCDFDQTEFGNSPVPPVRNLTGRGKSGVVTIEERILYEVESPEAQGSDVFFGITGFSNEPNPDAVFAKAICNTHLNYAYADNDMGALPEAYIGAETIVWDGENRPELPLKLKRHYNGADIVHENGTDSIEGWMAQSGSSSMGSGWVYDRVEDTKPYRTLYWGSGDYYYGVEEPIELPAGYGVMTFWDQVPMELFLLSENEATVLEATDDVVTEEK